MPCYLLFQTYIWRGWTIHTQNMQQSQNLYTRLLSDTHVRRSNPIIYIGILWTCSWTLTFNTNKFLKKFENMFGWMHFLILDINEELSCI